MNNDTIAAIATALSDAGIGIVRISGDQAIDIGNDIFATKKGCHNLKDYDSHTIHYGFIMDGEVVLDEVMISVMKSPNTYTREDVVEINCHGGVLIVKKVLDLVLKKGARLAEPGEFTKRAFLNGRIDLSRAEAVMDVIHSENEFALKAGISQLRGSVSQKIKELREKILYQVAFIESALDDPEHISIDGYNETLLPLVDKLIEEIKALADSAENGRIMKEGIKTVILGKPNAGKSSLLNVMSGEERAIVTEIAGTTRDLIEQNINLNGVQLLITDTAGIRETSDIVEKIGVERSIKSADDADLILYVVDSSVELDDSDRKIIDIIKKKNCIVLMNKSDLDQKISLTEMKEMLDGDIPVLAISALYENGMNELYDCIKDMFFKGSVQSHSEVVITNLRHKNALLDAYNSLLNVRESIEADMPEDFYSIDLMGAFASLGLIIGESVEDDLVTEIFSKFCMGK